MQKSICLCIIILLLSFASATCVEATEPTHVAAAAQAAPHAIDLVDDVARVPFTAAEVLYVPLGASEIVLSPLPGPSIASGITHVGKGILAPFKVGIVALKLPFQVIEELSSIGESSAGKTQIQRASQ